VTSADQFCQPALQGAAASIATELLLQQFATLRIRQVGDSGVVFRFPFGPVLGHLTFLVHEEQGDFRQIDRERRLSSNPRATVPVTLVREGIPSVFDRSEGNAFRVAADSAGSGGLGCR